MLLQCFAKQHMTSWYRSFSLMIIVIKHEDLKRHQGMYMANKHNKCFLAPAIKLNKGLWFLEIERANQSRIKRLCVSKGSLYPSEDFFFFSLWSGRFSGISAGPVYPGENWCVCAAARNCSNLFSSSVGRSGRRGAQGVLETLLYLSSVCLSHSQ